jgi:hypothetical protein
MRSSAVRLIVVLTIFLFLSNPAFAADLCITPDVLDAFAQAKLVFAGKILKVKPVLQDSASGSALDYVVSFEVEKWWKGTGPQQVNLVWRSSMLECSYLPVGEIGEKYLVYADPLTTASLGSESVAEITIFNRTSKLVLKRDLHPTSPTNFASQVSLDAKPKLNRADATEDVKVLSVLTRCMCVSSDSPAGCIDSSLSSGYPMPAGIQQSSRSSKCCECLRRSLRPF